MFNDLVFVLSPSFSFKEKQNYSDIIKENSGKISYFLNSNTTHFVLSETHLEDVMIKSRIKQIQEKKLNAYVVSTAYLDKCKESNQKMSENGYLLNLPNLLNEGQYIVASKEEDKKEMNKKSLKNRKKEDLEMPNEYLVRKMMQCALFTIKKTEEIAIISKAKQYGKKFAKKGDDTNNKRLESKINEILSFQTTKIDFISEKEKKLENYLRWDPLQNITPPNLFVTGNPHKKNKKVIVSVGAKYKTKRFEVLNFPKRNVEMEKKENGVKDLHIKDDVKDEKVKKEKKEFFSAKKDEKKFEDEKSEDLIESEDSLSDLSDISNDDEDDDENEKEKDDMEETENFEEKMKGKFNFKMKEEEVIVRTEIVQIENFVEKYISEAVLNENANVGKKRPQRRVQSEMLVSLKKKKRSLLLKYLKREKLRRRMFEMSEALFLKKFGIEKSVLFGNTSLSSSSSISNTNTLSSSANTNILSFSANTNALSSSFSNINKDEKVPNGSFLEKIEEKNEQKEENELLISDNFLLEEKLRKWSDYPLAIDDDEGGFWKKTKEEREEKRDMWKRESKKVTKKREKKERAVTLKQEGILRKANKRSLVQQTLIKLKDEGKQMTEKRKEEKYQKFREFRLEKRRVRNVARIKKKEKERKLKEKEERLRLLQQNKEKWEKYQREREKLMEGRKRARLDRDARKLFLGGVRFDDLEAVSKRGKLAELKNVSPQENLNRLKEQRKSWIVSVLMPSFGPVEKVLNFWEKEHIFVIFKNPEDAIKAFLTLHDFESKKHAIENIQKTYIKKLRKSKKNAKGIGSFKKETLLKKECVPKTNFYCRWPKTSPYFNMTINQLEQKINFVRDLPKVSNVVAEKSLPIPSPSPEEIASVEVKDVVDDSASKPPKKPINFSSLLSMHSTSDQSSSPSSSDSKSQTKKQEIVKDNLVIVESIN